MVNEWLVIIHVFCHIVAPLAHLLRCAVGVVILTGHDTCAEGLNENPPVDRFNLSPVTYKSIYCARGDTVTCAHTLITADVPTLGMFEASDATASISY